MNEKKIEAGSEQVYIVARALLEDFEAAKEKVIFRLTKKIEDPRILESYPNRPFLDMQIASNCNRGYGANVILYPGFLKQQAEKLGGDLVVIPSSVHEMLLIPEGQGEMDASELNRMVQFVNATEVPEEDVLGTQAYIYRADTDKLEMMETKMEVEEMSV